jgi:N-formylglutamate amidohydrolase
MPIYWFAVRQFGHPVIIAHRARAWIDLNRDEQDIDVEMVQGAQRADYPPPGVKQRGGSALCRADCRAKAICGNGSSR